MILFIPFHHNCICHLDPRIKGGGKTTNFNNFPEIIEQLTKVCNFFLYYCYCSIAVSALIRPLDLSPILNIAEHSQFVAGLEHATHSSHFSLLNHQTSSPIWPELSQEALIEPMPRCSNPGTLNCYHWAWQIFDSLQIRTSVHSLRTTTYNIYSV